MPTITKAQMEWLKKNAVYLGRVLRQCIKCKMATYHHKHEDDDKKTYHYCEDCNEHS